MSVVRKAKASGTNGFGLVAPMVGSPPYKGFGRKSAHISSARCPHAPLSLSHAVPAAPEAASGTRVMWLVAGCMAMPINHLTKHRQCSIWVAAVAVWRCKRWLSLKRESATDTTSAGGHRVHLTTDAHSHYHQVQRPICGEQPLHGANTAHVDVRGESGR